MGYRSQVVISVYEPGYCKLYEVCKEHKLEPERILKDGEVFSLEFNDIKWYKGWFTEIDAIENVLNELEECYNESEDKSYSFSFIRVGEENGDIEERFVGKLLTSAYVVQFIQVKGEEIEQYE